MRASASAARSLASSACSWRSWLLRRRTIIRTISAAMPPPARASIEGLICERVAESESESGVHSASISNSILLAIKT